MNERRPPEGPDGMEASIFHGVSGEPGRFAGGLPFPPVQHARTASRDLGFRVRRHCAGRTGRSGQAESRPGFFWLRMLNFSTNEFNMMIFPWMFLEPVVRKGRITRPNPVRRLRSATPHDGFPLRAGSAGEEGPWPRPFEPRSPGMLRPARSGARSRSARTLCQPPLRFLEVNR
jgi:hypothetical protein